MFALALACAVVFCDPVFQVQLRYPAYRTTITTTSGYNVTYTLAADAPPELRRAYKVLEVTEREVLIAEALQLYRAELVANERRLETLRTVRQAAYLTFTRAYPRKPFIDPAVVAPPESGLRGGVSQVLSSDARVERALAAIDRLADAHDQLHQALVAIAFPDRPRPVAAVRPAAVPPAVPGARVPAPIAGAERAEKSAAEAEVAAEERERAARRAEQAAEVRYRDSLPDERAAAKATWLKAREVWEDARRDWDTARNDWKTARDQLGKARAAARPVSTAGSVTRVPTITPPVKAGP